MEGIFYIRMDVSNNTSAIQGTGSPSHQVAVRVASWRWDHVGVYITIIVFVVISGLAKVGKSEL